MEPYIWYDYPYDGDFSLLGPRKRKMAEATRRRITESAEAGLMDAAPLLELFSSIPFLSDAALTGIGNTRGLSVNELREFHREVMMVPDSMFQKTKRQLLMYDFEQEYLRKITRSLRNYSNAKRRAASKKRERRNESQGASEPTAGTSTVTLSTEQESRPPAL